MHLAGYVSQYFQLIVELHPEHGVGQELQPPRLRALLLSSLGDTTAHQPQTGPQAKYQPFILAQALILLGSYYFSHSKDARPLLCDGHRMLK